MRGVDMPTARAASTTWSVYDGEWTPPADRLVCALPPLTGPLPSRTLRGCGLGKKEMLRRGAQGAVYAAYDTLHCDAVGGQPRLCAVKRLFTQQSDFGHRGVAETVLREATLLQRLAQLQQTTLPDPSVRIVGLDCVVEAPHRELCLVLEYCPYDLRRIFITDRVRQATRLRPVVETTTAATQSTLPLQSNATSDARCPVLRQLPLVRYLMRRMLRIVRFLHDQAHVLHRDIKLSNFLVTADGELRLSDFGSARFRCAAAESGGTAATSPTLSSAGGDTALVYTPSAMRTTLLYQPPECLLGQRQYDVSLDVWSLGVVFAELLLQRHLFSANSELAMVSAIWKLLGEPAAREPEQGSSISVEPSCADVQGILALKFPSAVVTDAGLDLLRGMLRLKPAERMTLGEAASHPFLHFDGEDADDDAGRALWLSKVHAVRAAELAMPRVAMPRLHFSSDDEEDDDAGYMQPSLPLHSPL